MRKRIESLARIYLKLFSFIEGAELEPTLFHSHYLSTRSMTSARRLVQSLLYGDVLDVGAGTGYGIRFRPENAKYFPTDIEGARGHRDSSLTRKGIALTKQCSVYEIDYSDNTFDACLALNLFEHLQYPARAIAEIKRVAKHDGQTVLLVPFQFSVHGYPHDYWRWSAEGLKHFLQENGATVKELLPCGRTVHSIALNLNLFLREGIVLDRHTPSVPRLFFYMLARPVLTLMFFIINVSALVFGALDRGAISPILICAVARNIKS